MRMHGEPVEQLDELQLVVKVVLEPQHYLVVPAGVAQRGVALAELPFHLPWRTPPCRGDESGALAGERVERHRRS